MYPDELGFIPTFADLAPGDRFLCGADHYFKLYTGIGKCFYQDDHRSFEVNAINAVTHEVTYIDPLSKVVLL